MTFKLTPKQEELRQVLRGQQTHTLAYGGSRSGKTFGFVHAIVKRASLAPNSQHLLARFLHSDARAKIMDDTFKAVMRLGYPDLPYQINKAHQYADLPNGARLWFAGLDSDERADKVLGAEYATIYLNECSQIPFDTVETVRSRLAQTALKENGKPLPLRMYYDLNPETAGHWTYQEFIEGVNPLDGFPIKNHESDYADIQMNPEHNPHLSQHYVKNVLGQMSMLKRKRFLEGKYLTALPDSLWSPAMIQNAKRMETPDISKMRRVVVAVDPGGTVTGDKTGIVVVGLDYHDKFHVLADLSLNGTPGEWGYAVLWAYHFFDAESIIVETNYGAEMCQHVLRTAAPRRWRYAFKVDEVFAGRKLGGKQARADKIIGLFENNRVSFSEDLYAHWPSGHQWPDGSPLPADVEVPKRPKGHANSTELFDQLMSFVPAVSGKKRKGKSPDNADAMVYALIELSGLNSRTPALNFKWLGPSGGSATYKNGRKVSASYRGPLRIK